MTPDRRRLAATLHLVAGAMFLLAGVFPTFRGGKPNVAFIALAPVWFALGAITLRKRNEQP